MVKRATKENLYATEQIKNLENKPKTCVFDWKNAGFAKSLEAHIYSKAETVIKHNDIEICNVQVKHMCNGDYGIECTLKNNGYQNADNVAISFNSNGDDIIKETEIEHLNSGETCTVSVELTADEYACISDKTLYCEVTSSLSERSEFKVHKVVAISKLPFSSIHPL